MRHLIAPMKNRWNGHVEASDSELKVYDKAGNLVVHASKDGNGSIVDHSESEGLDGRYSLEPIPKEARLYEMENVMDGKRVVSQKLVKVKDYDARLAARKEFQDSKGRVKSCAELEEAGYSFDKKQLVEKRPEAKK